jgi:hypothetical protein
MNSWRQLQITIIYMVFLAGKLAFSVERVNILFETLYRNAWG